MTFSTQRLTNKFPTWTKIRRDPSSLGARMFSVFADYFDFRNVELVKLRDEFNLLKCHLGHSNVSRIELDDDDQMPVNISTGGVTSWTYPTTVSGVFSTGTKTLSRVDNLEELLWSVPDEIILQNTIPVTNFLIWDSSVPNTINVIDNADRLMVIVENSTDYYPRARLKNPQASGYHLLVIRGKDHNGLDFVELLPVPDDGVYFTSNIISEIEEIIIEGFNGNVYFYVNSPFTSSRMFNDPYHAVASDREDGFLKLALDGDELKYYVQRIKNGYNYRTGDTSVVDNNELIWDQALADTGGTALANLIDFAVNLDTARLYVLDNTGIVYVYDYGMTTFSPSVDEGDLTRDVFMEIQPLAHWASLNETMTMFTWFNKPRFPVVNVTVKRRDPSGNVEYLQSNLTWSAGLYQFVGKNTNDGLAEDSWDELTFTNTFDEYGEWEFYCTVSLSSGDTSTMVTKVMVDKLTAIAQFSTGIGTPTGIYFSETSELCVTDANNIYKYSEHSHKYLANGPSQQLYFREDYTSVEVTL